jgi:hypothetical protein
LDVTGKQQQKVERKEADERGPTIRPSSTAVAAAVGWLVGWFCLAI